MTLAVVMDHWNAALEFGGSLFICISIRKLLQDKLVRGVSWVHVSYWSLWGFSNLIYYPALGSWWSFYAGIACTMANTTYVTLLIYYTLREKRTLEETDGSETIGQVVETQA